MSVKLVKLLFVEFTNMSLSVSVAVDDFSKVWRNPSKFVNDESLLLPLPNR